MPQNDSTCGVESTDEAGPAAAELPREAGRRKAAAWAVGLIVLLAFLVRAHGLSHDLDLGRIYHPDTPKQIHAAERFADGVFYFETGDRDYDGYPCFNSLITAGVYRLVSFVADTARNHLGIRPGPERDRVTLLNWIALADNVLLSTFAVWVLFLLARRVARTGVALVAALFFALSPLDIVACHYASGETASAFFALLSLYFAARICQDGRLADYVLSALFCLCAFSAKYHCALVCVCLITAHILWVGSFKGLFKPVSLGRAALVLLTVVVVFFLTNPGALVRTSRGIQKIVEFLQLSSDFGRAEQAQGLTGLARFAFGIRANVPVFARFLTPILFACALAGILTAFLKDKACRVVAVLPIAYFAVGLSSKTADNPVYSTLVTPAMILLGVVAIADLMAFTAWKPLPRILGSLMLLLAGLLLGNAAWQELFFFRHEDTRLLLEQWLKENAPAQSSVKAGRYAFLAPDLLEKEAAVTNDIWVRCDRRERVPSGYFLMNRLILEEKSLALFRNWPAEIYARESRNLERNWRLPVCQKIPSAFAPVLILADSADFYRSAKVFDARAGRPARKTLVARAPIEDVVVTARCGPVPARVRVSVGGRTQEWNLASDQAVWAAFGRVRRRWPLLKDLWAYRVSADSSGGPVRVTLAVTPEEKAMTLFQMGEYAAARDRMPRSDNPTVAAAAALSRAIAGKGDGTAGAESDSLLQAYLDREFGVGDMSLVYAVSAARLDGISYLSWPARDLQADGFRCEAKPDLCAGDLLTPEETTNAARRVSSPLVMLPGGCYRARLRFVAFWWHPVEPGPIRVNLLDAAGRLVCAGTTLETKTLDSPLFGAFDVAFQKPAGPASARIVAEVPSTSDLMIRDLSVQPDPVAGVDALKDALGVASSDVSPLSAAQLVNYDVLMGLADAFNARGLADRGALCYAAASCAYPTRIEPLDALAKAPQHIRSALPDDVKAALAGLVATGQSRRVRPVEAAFAGGIRLTGWRLSADRVRPGEEVGLRLLWDVSETRRPLGSVAVWAHFVNAEGRTVFRGDHGIVFDLASPEGIRLFGTEDCFRVQTPADAAPGSYTIRVGLWVPRERNRLKLERASAPSSKHGVEIGTLTVE
ncbi:MAG: glycosyltransferase family 39 protein [Verrucomicrobiota bacterium]|nr:glycosyltransferase family 39 protein [Verrucomicrobiota bacterium]